MQARRRLNGLVTSENSYLRILPKLCLQEGFFPLIYGSSVQPLVEGLIAAVPAYSIVIEIPMRFIAQIQHDDILGRRRNLLQHLLKLIL